MLSRHIERDSLTLQIDTMPSAAALDASLASGVVDEDTPHGLSSGSEEVAAAVPVLRFLSFHQAQIGFMNKSRGLERLPRLLLRQLLRRQLAELVVDERQELLGGTGVALLDGGQNARDLGHSGQFTAPKAARLRRRNAKSADRRAGS